jgi:hypothetical protein
MNIFLLVLLASLAFSGSTSFHDLSHEDLVNRSIALQSRFASTASASELYDLSFAESVSAQLTPKLLELFSDDASCIPRSVGRICAGEDSSLRNIYCKRVAHSFKLVTSLANVNFIFVSWSLLLFDVLSTSDVPSIYSKCSYGTCSSFMSTTIDFSSIMAVKFLTIEHSGKCEMLSNHHSHHGT